MAEVVACVETVWMVEFRYWVLFRFVRCFARAVLSFVRRGELGVRFCIVYGLFIFYLFILLGFWYGWFWIADCIICIPTKGSGRRCSERERWIGRLLRRSDEPAWECFGFVDMGLGDTDGRSTEDLGNPCRGLDLFT